MDATHKDSLIAQITGNGKMDFRDADSLVKIVGKMNETRAESLMRSGAKRFFYNSSTEEIVEKLSGALTANELKSGQMRANKMARDDNYISKVFKTTYTRGGHKYVDGFRIY